ncbi:CPBP family intramembrane glutamic endopeptidase [Pontibacillus sp. HMF3514]|uniref:CPBP family intramembrane glutamic endopeptidase n=1 Tax=Pontibacillus sp. HMF3514 TaxID=2692425 RepID=UPI00131FE75B|nr:CPBP family intramembrane glutamic endopeptidase [Pontibacillus sp. HMF3514]QHE52552.1 CPBP family intramembrane metalloprotease [Pontibacillus sp. HMF3514]
MKWTNQAEIIKQLSDRQVVNHLYLTQGIILAITVIASLFLFPSLTKWLDLWKYDVNEILIYGVSAGFIVLIIDVLLMIVLPKRFYDDGGINQKVFRNRPVLEILWIAFLVAFAEELLFRGVIHTTFGYITASIAFGFMHIRYLTKPVLLISVLLISFYLGWMFEVTSNLFVTITAHFMIDFILGLLIRFKIMG